MKTTPNSKKKIKYKEIQNSSRSRFTWLLLSQLLPAQVLSTYESLWRHETCLTHIYTDLICWLYIILCCTILGRYFFFCTDWLLQFYITNNLMQFVDPKQIKFFSVWKVIKLLVYAELSKYGAFNWGHLNYNIIKINDDVEILTIRNTRVIRNIWCRHKC